MTCIKVMPLYGYLEHKRLALLDLNPTVRDNRLILRVNFPELPCATRYRIRRKACAVPAPAGRQCHSVLQNASISMAGIGGVEGEHLIRLFLALRLKNDLEAPVRTHGRLTGPVLILEHFLDILAGVRLVTEHTDHSRDDPASASIASRTGSGQDRPRTSTSTYSAIAHSPFPTYFAVFCGADWCPHDKQHDNADDHGDLPGCRQTCDCRLVSVPPWQPRRPRPKLCKCRRSTYRESDRAVRRA